MARSDAGTSLESEYQVFLNFRGPDTREGFTDFLFHSLTDAGISVFLDDEELCVGERIDGSLEQAIHNSKIYIPIFSQNYASSQWCLRELLQIVANTSISKGNKEILPIFFNVHPDDVKLKTPLYRNAIQKLKHEKKLSDEEVDEWRDALMEVDAIKGWEVKKYKGHGKFIKVVVEMVVKKLKTKHRKVTNHLVGINDRVVAVRKLLDINSDDVRLICIYGMGGIGKTTLAKVVFNELSSLFGKCCCFLEDIRANSSHENGLVELQRKLLSEISNPMGTWSIDNSDDGMKRIEKVLHNKKVLIILDDIDKSTQVEKLVGEKTLYSRSRILITTRNKDVLRIHKSKYHILEYEMEVMSIDCALELFSRHAFDSDSPSDDYSDLSDDYSDLSRDITSATGRLPLALEVVGSFLYNRRRQIWHETLKKLRKAPHEDVFGKLKISFDALTLEQQQIFLDIACFFIGEDKRNPTYMWKDCEFSVETGVEVLINMSLVKIVKHKFWMHDQLRDFGREIVHQENPTNPGKCSRLWIQEEILNTITTKKMKKVQALNLNLCRSYLNLIQCEDIGRFEHLKYLKLNGGTLVGNLENCLTKLRWFIWSHPPQTSKPITMNLKNVVILQFSDNDVIDDSKLQGLIKMARKLKVLSLKSCNNITQTPNFSECLNLERLTFKCCSQLRKIDSSIGKLKCLTELRIGSCGCLEDLPNQIGDLVKLKLLSILWCKVKKLPESIWKLRSLLEVHFEGDFDGLPSAIGLLQNLKVLQVSSRYLKDLPNTIHMLPHLRRLKLMRCDKIQELPVLPTSLTHLIVSSRSLHYVSNLRNLTNLVELDLDVRGRAYGNHLWWIENLSKLTNLRLRLCNVRISTELVFLPLLKKLDLHELDVQTVLQLPLSLQYLALHDANSTESLSLIPINLSPLKLRRSPWQDLVPQMKRTPLQELTLSVVRVLRAGNLDVRCHVNLERLRLSGMRKLKEVLVSCPKLVEIQCPLVFESLEVLFIEGCESLGSLTYLREAGHNDNGYATDLTNCEGRLILPLRALNKLRRFTLGRCSKILEIQIVGMSGSWEYFSLFECPYVQSLDGLSNLKKLKDLNIKDNERLQVVKGLDELEFLDNLQVHGCGLLERLIDLSSTKLPNYCHIHTSGCRWEDIQGYLEYYKHHWVSLAEPFIYPVFYIRLPEYKDFGTLVYLLLADQRRCHREMIMRSN